MRAWSFPLFATDSTTTPDKTAFFGMTVPLTKVAAASFAWTFAPTDVLPLSMLCSNVTGNSCNAGAEEAAGVCWPSNAVDDKPSIRRAITVREKMCLLSMFRRSTHVAPFHGQSIHLGGYAFVAAQCLYPESQLRNNHEVARMNCPKLGIIGVALTVLFFWALASSAQIPSPAEAASLEQQG